MAKTIIRVLRLESPLYDFPNPNSTLFVDATAAKNLGMYKLSKTGEQMLTFSSFGKTSKMKAVLHSLEYPVGNLIRLTDKALHYFKLENGKLYWFEWNNRTKQLKVLKRVQGK